jgi:phosphoribosylglycinamide formyltransferase-1
VSPARLLVCASGGGRSLENLVQAARRGALDAEVALVVASKPGIGALERARRLGIPWLVLDPERELSPERLSEELFAAADEAGCALVVLAGWLRLLRVPERWRGRVVNIHPALLPAFGGRGYWGLRVHRAVLERGSWFTGCTVHLVDDEYDHGPILLQRVVRVRKGDTPETLAARVFRAEKKALPEALRRLLAGESGPPE